MTWPAFPKRLQSALKALCCLANSGEAMQSQVIAEQIEVPAAETAKILQLLVWGGFVHSRRGTRGGFQLAGPADKITMGKVIDFFLARHPAEPDGDFPVMRALRQTMAACQKKFAHMTLSDAAAFPSRGRHKKLRAPRKSAPRTTHSNFKRALPESKRRSHSNASNPL